MTIRRSCPIPVQRARPQHIERERDCRHPQAPVIRQIFELYAAGRFSFQTLADHLNSLGIRPKRGSAKAKHNRPAAIIFTGDVLKDILDNPSYLGKVRVDGELIEAKHPALIDEATWSRCLQVRSRNRRTRARRGRATAIR